MEVKQGEQRRPQYTNSQTLGLPIRRQQPIPVNYHPSLASRTLGAKSSVSRPMTAEEYKDLLVHKLLRLHGKPKPVKAGNRTFHSGSQSLPTTNQISEYELGSVLGQGGCAIVRSAVHKSSQTTFAIKTYEKYRLLEPNRRQGVVREIKVLSVLRHPHVVRLREVVEEEKEIHLVMELVQGISLYQYLQLQPDSRLSDSQCLFFFRQLVSALTYCHSLSIAHRDLKLDNILVSQSEQLTIIDFGFATRTPQRCKLFCGTTGYMAPEIVMKKEYCALKADIWALGVVLYVMLSGELPFQGKSEKEIIDKVKKATIDIPPFATPGAANVLEEMLRKKPDKRPTAASLLRHPWLRQTDSLTSGVRLHPLSPKVLSGRDSALDSPSLSLYLATD